jgi:hypothetical protein
MVSGRRIGEVKGVHHSLAAFSGFGGPPLSSSLVLSSAPAPECTRMTFRTGFHAVKLASYFGNFIVSSAWVDSSQG